MEFSEKGPTDPMNGHFSPINGLESINGVQFSLCGTPTNLIFAHRVGNCLLRCVIPPAPSIPEVTSEFYAVLKYGTIEEKDFKFGSFDRTTGTPLQPTTAIGLWDSIPTFF